MSDIVDRLMLHASDLFFGHGVDMETIIAAESRLHTRFAPDFRHVLLKLGLIAFDGHELTGISEDQRLDVVTVTLHQHDRNREISPDWYVIEDAGMDGIIVWQSPEGIIYESAPGSSLVKLANDLAEYLGL